MPPKLLPQTTVAVIHTGPATIEPLKQRFARFLPDIRVINIMDDSLLTDVRTANQITTAVMNRMCHYFMLADSMKVAAILNACSSVGDTVPMAQTMVTAPIIRIDDPMAEQAVALGTVIGVVATVPTTLDPTVRLIKQKALQRQKSITVHQALCEGAFDLLLAGKPDEHDQLVLEKVRDLADKVDVIVLAQVSIARLIPKIGPDLQTPVLSSPDSGVQFVAQLLARA